MNLKKSMMLAKNEWLILLKDQNIIFSIFLISTIFSIILPVVVFLTFHLSGQVLHYFPVKMFESILYTTVDDMMTMDIDQRVLYFIIDYVLLPFFIVLPIIVSSITASESFVGEKERKTVEWLLASPLNIQKFICGKILASFLPALLIEIMAVVVYNILANVIGNFLFSVSFFPSALWAMVTLLISPLISFLFIELMIFISYRSKSVRSAQSMASLLLLPILILFISQAVGIVFISFNDLVMLGIVLLVLDTFLFAWIINHFNIEDYILDE